MDENLISKKELLAETGISYGSLYRWKRLQLIPDAWFIHRATYTGQETFFPREKILERIRQIQDLKEGMSLEDIAETFSPAPPQISYTPQTVAEMGIASRAGVELYLQYFQDEGPYDFPRLLHLYCFDRLLQTGNIARDEAAQGIALLKGGETEDKKLLFFRKLGICFSILTEESASVRFDSDTKLIYELSLPQFTAALKQLMSDAQKG